MIDLSTDEGMRAAFREIAAWTPDETIDGVVPTVVLATRSRGRRPVLLAAAAVTLLALVATAVWVGLGRRDSVPAAGGSWSAMATSPLEPRRSPWSVWTGDELLVWGGYRAGGTLLRDGAAYSPATDTWRAISPMPSDFGFDIPAPFFPPNRVGFVNGEALTILEDPQVAGAWTIVGYRPATDSWRVVDRRVADADPSGQASPVAFPQAWAEWRGRLVVVGWRGAVPSDFGWAMFEPTTGRWTDFTVVSDSMDMLSTGAGGSPIVIADRYLVLLSSAGAYLNAGVIVDLVAGTGQTLAFPSRPGELGYYWSVDATGTAVGIAIVTDEHGFNVVKTVAERLDPATGSWARVSVPPSGVDSDVGLPSIVALPRGHLLFGGFALGSATIDVRRPGPVAMVADEGVTTWSSLPRPPIDAERVDPVMVWTGSEVIVWGGWTMGDNGEVALADGARYRPPAAVTP